MTTRTLPTALPRTDLDQLRASWDFAFAFGEEDYGYGNTPPIGFTRADIQELYRVEYGKRDGCSWVAIGRLADGRFFRCDYTGWDCRASNSGKTWDTLDAFLNGLGDEDRSKLAFGKDGLGSEVVSAKGVGNWTPESFAAACRRTGIPEKALHDMLADSIGPSLTKAMLEAQEPEDMLAFLAERVFMCRCYDIDGALATLMTVAAKAKARRPICCPFCKESSALVEMVEWEARSKDPLDPDNEAIIDEWQCTDCARSFWV